MTHTPEKSYSKADYLVQFKELQDEIQLEKNKLEILRSERKGLNSRNETFRNDAQEKLDAIKLEHDELAKDIKALAIVEGKLGEEIQKENLELIELVNQREKEKEYLVELHKTNKQLLDDGMSFSDSFEKSKEKKIKEYNKIIVKLEKKRDNIEIKEVDFEKREADIKIREVKLDVRDNLIVQKERVAERYARRIVKDFEKKYPKIKVKYI